MSKIINLVLILKILFMFLVMMRFRCRWWRGWRGLMMRNITTVTVVIRILGIPVARGWLVVIISAKIKAFFIQSISIANWSVHPNSNLHDHLLTYMVFYLLTCSLTNLLGHLLAIIVTYLLKWSLTNLHDHLLIYIVFYLLTCSLTNLHDNILT